MPELLLPPDAARSFAAPPAMGAMLAAQTIFVLMFCSLLIHSRGSRTLRRYLIETRLEYAVLLAAMVPLYVIAAWLSDAGVRDVLRCLLYLSLVMSAAWGLSLWARGPGTAAAVGFVAALGAVGLPVVRYLLVELAGGPAWAGGLGHAAPATFAFDLAARSGTFFVGPLWAWMLWPVVGAVAALSRLAFSVRARAV